ncbi:MAG TPA: hypothetical protein VIM70_01585 [Clostridium sp.]|uniref:hypothetical protein n=1 Tax=Clostridium sp. TaxID=1506 RepID=UPI002F9411C6
MSKDLIKVMVDTARGSVDKFSVKDGNKVVKEALVEICGSATPDYRTFRKHKNEIFEIVEVALDEVVTSGWADNTFFNQFVDFKDMNLGDKNEFVVESDSILTVSKIARGNLDIKTQRMDVGSVFSVPVSTYGLAVGESLLRIMAGRLDWSKLVGKVQEGFDNQLKDTIYTSMNASIAYLPSVFKMTGTFAAATLQSICDHVQAANGNAPIVIAGTKVALGNLYGTADISWSENMKNEMYTGGKLGFWRGLPLMPITQVHNLNTFDFKLDDTLLYILPMNVKPIKIVNEGVSAIVDESNGESTLDMSVAYKMVKNFGVSTIFNKLYGIYDL